MKFRKLSIPIIVIGFLYLLYGCGRCTTTYPPGPTPGLFTIPNLYTVINPKDTFHLNDTLWVRFQVPDSLSSRQGPCVLAADTLPMSSQCMLVYANNVDTPIQSKPLFYEMGNISNLQRYGSYYVAQFGIILDNKNIIGIGNEEIVVPGDTIMINNYSRNTPCRLPSGSCPTGYSVFSINTTFQNGQGIYPLIVR